MDEYENVEKLCSSKCVLYTSPFCTKEMWKRIIDTQEK